MKQKGKVYKAVRLSVTLSLPIIRQVHHHTHTELLVYKLHVTLQVSSNGQTLCTFIGQLPVTQYLSGEPNSVDLTQ